MVYVMYIVIWMRSYATSAVGRCSSVLQGGRVLKYWWSSFYSILLRIAGVFVVHLFDAVVYFDTFKIA
jgi:hypothetical protein